MEALSRYNRSLTAHCEALKTILRYLKGTSHCELRTTKDYKNQIRIYLNIYISENLEAGSDEDWVGELEDG